MGHFTEEGKFNENSFLIDAEFMKLKGTLALYLLENNGVRLLVDTGETLGARRLVKKLKSLGLFPIHKILLTHAHWDHIQGLPRILKQIEGIDVEILAHKNALPYLKDPSELNEYFGFNVEPLENVTPLKEGDIIDLKGFQLKIIEFFGHTQDSIALYDEIHKNIIVGDAIMDQVDKDSFFPVLFGPHFNEESLLKSYKKLQGMKDKLDSIALAHFGVYSGKYFQEFVDGLEDKYFNAKNSLIKWYKENPDDEYIAEKYQENIVPNSTLFTKENLNGVLWNTEQNIKALKAAGFIK